jgi:Tol biopolymer transport system component
MRTDLHPRFSHDGKTISFDSTHEEFGRQIYTMDISSIVENPPKN